MSILTHFINSILHLDKSLSLLIASYGHWVYAILFVIIFCETGLVVAPFLPGDSLLFAAGAFAAMGAFDVGILFILLFAAAILGDTVNYWIGNKFGEWIISHRWVKQEYLDKTHKFFEKHGTKTILFARFVPVVRTIAPFFAGFSKMDYPKFIFFNISGGLIWSVLFIFGGYFFGNFQIVKENFTTVIYIIILVSLLPPLIEYLRHKFSK